MKKILIGILLTSASYSYAQTINAEQIKKDNVTIRGNALHQLRADTAYLATHHYVDSLIAAGGSGNKVDSIDRRPGTDSVFYYINGAEHFAFIDSVSTATIAAAAWSLTGNVGTTPGTNFIGTIDSVDWVVKTNNSERVRVTGNGNVGIGTATPLAKTQVAGSGSLIANRIFRVTDNSDTTLLEIFGNGVGWFGTHNGGEQTGNLILGWESASSLGDSAQHNTVVGVLAGRLLRNAERSTLIGFEVGANIVGFGSGGGGSFGYENTAGGYLALNQCTTCFENTVWGAFGARALLSGTGNVMVGLSAGENGITQSNCVMVGVNAGRDNTANNSTYVGNAAGWKQTSGEANWVGGYLAMFNSTNSTGCTVTGAVAYQTATSGNFNDVYGFDAGAGLTTGSGNCIWGHRAAKYTNYDNAIILDNRDRGSAAKEVTHQAIYIQTQSDSSAQVGRHNYVASFYGVNDSRRQISTSAGDAVTMDGCFQCRMRKDTSGDTFTFTNAIVTANSGIQLTPANAAIDATATTWTALPGAGTVTIKFNAAPTANFDFEITIIN